MGPIGFPMKQRGCHSGASPPQKLFAHPALDWYHWTFVGRPNVVEAPILSPRTRPFNFGLFVSSFRLFANLRSPRGVRRRQDSLAAATD